MTMAGRFAAAVVAHCQLVRQRMEGFMLEEVVRF
jgi:hypothetical protein